MPLWPKQISTSISVMKSGRGKQDRPRILLFRERSCCSHRFTSNLVRKSWQSSGCLRSPKLTEMFRLALIIPPIRRSRGISRNILNHSPVHLRHLRQDILTTSTDCVQDFGIKLSQFKFSVSGLGHVCSSDDKLRGYFTVPGADCHTVTHVHFQAVKTILDCDDH